MARFPVQTSEFQTVITSVADGTIPSATYGTAVTCGVTNAYGSYASVLSGASLTSDAYGIEIFIHTCYQSSTDRGHLATVGFDPAGGTSFGGLGGVTGNEIKDLLCNAAGPWYASVGQSAHRFYFPLLIESGTSIGIKGQTSAATAGTMRVFVKLYCKPSRRAAVRAGSFVRTFGANTTTTTGTAVTQGTASEGAWTEIGTAADKLWYLETGIAARSATLANEMSHSDVGVGDASNKRTVLQDLAMYTTTSETTTKLGNTGAFVNIASGDKIYGRSQASVAQPGFAMTAYGVGG
jgi:hypothetical protein